MTVAELIDTLTAFPDDAVVLLADPNGNVSTIVQEDLVAVMTDGKQVLESEANLRRAWVGLVLNGQVL